VGLGQQTNDKISHSKALKSKQNQRTSYLIFSHCRTCVVKPPHRNTVTITMIDVVESIVLRAGDDVFLMARANATAPRSPSTITIITEHQKMSIKLSQLQKEQPLHWNILLLLNTLFAINSDKTQTKSIVNVYWQSYSANLKTSSYAESWILSCVSVQDLERKRVDIRSLHVPPA